MGQISAARTPRELARALAGVAHRLRQSIAEALDAPVAVPFPGVPPAYPPLSIAEYADLYAQCVVYQCFAERLLGRRVAVIEAWPHAVSTAAVVSLRDECTAILAQALEEAIAGSSGDPLVHFYETFLAAYNPQQRGRRGVYYTPQPVVSYIVRSVDALLHQHFPALSGGILDARVTLLDPAMGTATFLCGVVQHIHAALAGGAGAADGWGPYVRDTLRPRLVGVEVLPTPFAIAHLRLRLLLAQQGVSLAADAPLRLSLANALGGDSPPASGLPVAGQGTPAPLVVLGNPPFSNYGRLNRGAWITAQLQEYKRGLDEKKLNLNDDCIKFVRFGQWAIERAGAGILAFVINNTYLDGLTHRRMRESLLETFDTLYLLDLHGSARRGEGAPPGGGRDENVFAIRQGVALALLVKSPGGASAGRVWYASLWGKRAEKYATLQASDSSSTPWVALEPRAAHFFFVPRGGGDERGGAEYAAAPGVTNLFTTCQGALKTDRDRLFVALEREALTARMQAFYSSEGLSPAFRAAYRVEDSSSYPILRRRERTQFDPAAVRRCLYRPFDVRWLYYAPDLVSRPSYGVMRHMLAGDNLALLVCRQQDASGFAHVFCTDCLTEACAVSIKTREGAYLIPLYRYEDGERVANISAEGAALIEERCGLRLLPQGRGDLQQTMGPEDVLHMLYALLHHPVYRRRYAEALRIDFPRVFLPRNRAVLGTLAAVGAALVDVHMLRLPGVGGVGGAGGAALLCDPAAQGVWVEMAETARVERVAYVPPAGEHPGRVVFSEQGAVVGVAPEDWAMRVGSYAPLQAWLKARRGCLLCGDDVRHYQRVVVALRETRRLMGELERVAVWASVGGDGG
jgi:hypothetical protein